MLLEIVRYWRPEYLRRKFDKIARSNRRDLVIAVSEVAERLEGRTRPI